MVYIDKKSSILIKKKKKSVRFFFCKPYWLKLNWAIKPSPLQLLALKTTQPITVVSAESPKKKGNEIFFFQVTPKPPPHSSQLLLRTVEPA